MLRAYIAAAIYLAPHYASGLILISMAIILLRYHPAAAGPRAVG